jgi:hypothetical protein
VFIFITSFRVKSSKEKNERKTSGKIHEGKMGKKVNSSCSFLVCSQYKWGTWNETHKVDGEKVPPIESFE